MPPSGFAMDGDPGLASEAGKRSDASRCRAYREVFTACRGRQYPHPHCPDLSRSYLFFT
jgi:hypothetical protein